MTAYLIPETISSNVEKPGALKNVLEKFAMSFETLGDPTIKYVPPKPIKLNKKVRQFCSDMDGIDLKWSMCGQFWGDVEPGTLENKLSTLYPAEVLCIKDKNTSRTFYAERIGRRVTVSDKCPIGFPFMWLSGIGIDDE